MRIKLAKDCKIKFKKINKQAKFQKDFHIFLKTQIFKIKFGQINH